MSNITDIVLLTRGSKETHAGFEDPLVTYLAEYRQKYIDLLTRTQEWVDSDPYAKEIKRGLRPAADRLQKLAGKKQTALAEDPAPVSPTMPEHAGTPLDPNLKDNASGDNDYNQSKTVVDPENATNNQPQMRARPENANPDDANNPTGDVEVVDDAQPKRPRRRNRHEDPEDDDDDDDDQDGSDDDPEYEASKYSPERNHQGNANGTKAGGNEAGEDLGPAPRRPNNAHSDKEHAGALSPPLMGGLPRITRANAGAINIAESADEEPADPDAANADAVADAQAQLDNGPDMRWARLSASSRLLRMFGPLAATS